MDNNVNMNNNMNNNRRIIHYLSPSSINLFYSNLKEFYIKYLWVNANETNEIDAHGNKIIIYERLRDTPQTQPMSIGSAFDAYVKSYLHEKLFGKNNDPKYDLNNLFEAQVEPHLRDWAWMHGKYVFEQYQKSGALADLMLELEGAIGTPKFEIEIKGTVGGYREGVTKNFGNDNVTLLGRPDVFYVNKYGVYVILDFKVNNYCSKYACSPLQGYIRLRSSDQIYSRNAEIFQNHHKSCFPKMWKGTLINGDLHTGYLENLKPDWALQLSVYAWLLGCNVGEEFITAIDQICCNNTIPQKWKYDNINVNNNEHDINKMTINQNILDVPSIKIAQHRLRVNPDWQYLTFAKIQHAWEVCHSNWIFRDMSEKDSIAQCELLDQVAKIRFDEQKMLEKGNDQNSSNENSSNQLSYNDKWFNNITK